MSINFLLGGHDIAPTTKRIPMITRKELEVLRDELRACQQAKARLMIRANKAEKEIKQLNKRADEYLEIYKQQNLELEALRRNKP